MIWMIPFVNTLEINPTNDPHPIFKAVLMLDLFTSNSPNTAPRNGPIKIPNIGIIKGPTNSPIVLPQTPAFVPPNFLTPIRLAA